MHDGASSAYLFATIVAFLALPLVGRRAFRNRTYARFVIVVVIVAIGAANLAPYLRIDVGAAVAAVAIGALSYSLVTARARLPHRRRWLDESRSEPLVLVPPFDGIWSVAIGGPDPANHHLIASDQRFACDLVRRDGRSYGTRVLAPVSGEIVVAHDGIVDWPPSLRVREHDVPLGNHVAIDTGRGVVFLCHLQNGSVRVRAGDTVEIGTEIGRCGNSGRTSRPHLHVHAQDLAHYAFNRAAGIPIVFRTGTSFVTPLPGKRISGQPSSTA